MKSQCRWRSEFDLVNIGIGSSGVKLLCESLQRNSCGIERLYLGGNGLDDSAAEPLADVLRSNTQLKSLHLNVGSLGDFGVSTIGRSLRRNRTLRELSLASNGISAEGARSLLASITKHPRLINLDLGYSPSTRVLGALPNALGDEGGRLIADMIRDNRVLRQLNLAKTQIGSLGRAAIEDALLANTTIVNCVLDGGLSSRVCTHLKENQNLESQDEYPGNDVKLIRSVYRTNKKTQSQSDGA